MPDTREQVRNWLLKYSWLGPKERDERIVDCIMSQDGWKSIDAVADKYAGAQNEPGPAAFAEGTEFSLSALYECHDGPHLDTCPDHKEE
jgi:hypothetical protein